STEQRVEEREALGVLQPEAIGAVADLPVVAVARQHRLDGSSGWRRRARGLLARVPRGLGQGAPQTGHAARFGRLASGSEKRSRSLAIAGLVPREEQARKLVLRPGERRVGPDARVGRERGLVMPDRALYVPQRPGKEREVAMGRAEAPGRIDRHDQVALGEGLEQAVQLAREG